ncbi:MAG: ferrous iron transport protein A, partial [Thermoprotei archaeon]
MVSKRLSELEPGDTAVIVRIEGSGAVARRMADMGLIPGTKVKVVRKAPLGDPI